MINSLFFSRNFKIVAKTLSVAGLMKEGRRKKEGKTWRCRCRPLVEANEEGEGRIIIIKTNSTA
jgi:hypothetical protein